MEMASGRSAEVDAIDLPSENPLGITFATSTDADLIAASPRLDPRPER